MNYVMHMFHYEPKRTLQGQEELFNMGAALMHLCSRDNPYRFVLIHYKGVLLEGNNSGFQTG